MVGFALAIALVVLIAFAQQSGWTRSFDNALVEAFGNGRSSVNGQSVTAIMLASSQVGGTTGRLFLMLGVCAILLWRHRRHDALWMIAAVIGGIFLNLALKQVFAAPRPDILPHLDNVSTFSFPSGHAAGNMVLFGAAAILSGGTIARIAAIIVIALIGVSRVWLGVHWPSDILAGWIEGIGWLLLCSQWRNRGRRPLSASSNHAV